VTYSRLSIEYTGIGIDKIKTITAPLPEKGTGSVLILRDDAALDVVPGDPLDAVNTLVLQLISRKLKHTVYRKNNRQV
jgi:hypothetical protein